MPVSVSSQPSSVVQGTDVDAGIVENTPKRQSPAPAPGAARLTNRLWVEKAAAAPFGLVAATDRPTPRPPLRPPSSAAGNSSGSPLSPWLPAAATGSTSLKNAASSARACDC